MDERHPGRHHRAEHTGRTGENGAASRKRGEEAYELRHQDQRPGRGFGEAEPVDHLGRRHPVMGFDRLLRHIGQHRIGAAEAHHRELGEERADAHQHVVRAKRERGERHRRPPGDQTDQRRNAELPPAIPRGGAKAFVVFRPTCAGDGRATK